MRQSDSPTTLTPGKDNTDAIGRNFTSAWEKLTAIRNDLGVVENRLINASHYPLEWDQYKQTLALRYDDTYFTVLEDGRLSFKRNLLSSGGGGGGTVTSVGLSAPVGWVVGGSPVIAAGVLTLNYAAGYSLPLTADVANGVTAFGWGNHAGLYPTLAVYNGHDHSAGDPTQVAYANLTGIPATFTPSAHAVLDSTYHSDVLTGAITRGDILYGNATPKIARLPAPAGPGYVLYHDGTDVAWSADPLVSTLSTVLLRLDIDEIYEYATNADNGQIYINFNGYNGGITRFRNFGVYDGKNAACFYIDGTTKLASFYGGATIAAGNLTIGTLAGLLLGTAGVVSAITPVLGGIVVATAGPVWTQYAISVPAANVRNVLGVDNAETVPTWKASLDGTMPETIAIAGAGQAGTSLIYSHRDHNHPAPATWTATAHNLLSATHGDTLADTVIAGDLMVGNATPKWARLPNVAVGSVLASTGVNTPLAYTTTPQVTGISLNGAPGWIRPVVDSVNALQIQRVGSGVIMSFDTTNSLVNIGPTTTSAVISNAAALHVGGTGLGTYAAISNYNAGVGGAVFYFLRGNGTYAAPSPVLDTDLIMSIAAAGQATTTIGIINSGAAIQAFAEGNWSAGSNPTNLLFKTCPSGGGAVVERLRITNGGLVGINCTPTLQFEVTNNQNATTAAIVRNTTSGANVYTYFGLISNAYSSSLGMTSTTSGIVGVLAVDNLYLQTTSLGIAIYANNANGVIKFGTGGTAERARFDAAGGFVVGAKAAAATGLLEVYSSTASPVLTITGLHASSYDPTIGFRTDSPATYKAMIGVDSTDDSLWLTVGATLNAARTGVITAYGIESLAFAVGTPASTGFAFGCVTSPAEMTYNGVNITVNHTLGAGAKNFIARGLYFDARSVYGATVVNAGSLIGFEGNAYHNTASSIANVYGGSISFGSTLAAALVTGWARGLNLQGQQIALISNYADIYINAPSTTVTPTNDWCIYSLHAAPSLLSGQLGITAVADPWQYFKHTDGGGGFWYSQIVMDMAAAHLDHTGLTIVTNNTNVLGAATWGANNTFNYLGQFVQSTAGVINTLINAAGDSYFTNNLKVLSDSAYLKLGAGNDFGMRYDGTYGILDSSLVAPSDIRITCGANKTIELQNTVYEDLEFPIIGSVLPGVNTPTFEAFTINTKEYSFAVNDYLDPASRECPHSWKIGTAGTVHLHITPKTAQSTGANRYAKFTVYVAYADVDEVWTETSFTAEYTIPTGTAALTHFLLEMGTLTLTNQIIGNHIKVRVKRIAATGGTEYADNVFIDQCAVHLQDDTLGSRQEHVK
jgi:hypothetical protein